jgi:hypothetical protein
MDSCEDHGPLEAKSNRPGAHNRCRLGICLKSIFAELLGMKSRMQQKGVNIGTE